jgi:outer membrane protein
MRTTPRILNTLIVSGLATVMLASCVDKKATIAKTETKATEAPATPPTGKIAYVNIDSFQTKYEYFIAKKAEFEKRTAGMDAEVDRMAQNLQNEYAAFQKKAQAGTLSQAEGEAGQKKLGQMQQNLENRRQNLGAMLMKEQEEFNQGLQKRLDDYLVKYNADKGYDYILSYAKGGSILFANKALDITEDVVKGMNAEDKAKPAEETKPATGK